MIRANAATKLQAAWQGKLGRARFRAAQKKKLRNDMASKINNAVLGYLGRCRFRRELIRVKGNFMATLIQSIARMFIVRSKLSFYVQERRR